jgi:hypothetical protein
MGTIGGLCVTESGRSIYVNRKDLAPKALELAKQFLEWLKTPPNDTTKESPHAFGQYTRDLAFYVFHDNVKSQGEAEKENPLYDMSSFLEFMSKHEKELRCRVIKTPMVDNLWHSPKGYHPGRVFILIPPWAHIYEEGSKVSVEEKVELLGLSKDNTLTKEDKDTIKSIVS